MSTSKVRVFSPGAASRYEGVPVIEKLIQSQVDVLTEQQLATDQSQGRGIRVAFYCGTADGNKILDYYEQGVLPDLGLICNHGVGVDHIPKERLRKGGLRLTNTPNVLSDATADMAFALMLASGRMFTTGIQWAMHMSTAQKSTQWSYDVLGQDICYATLGIVGMGSIGYKIAERAKAFNMEILYFNRRQRPVEEEEAVAAKYYANLISMLELCDFVVISCPLTSETKDMFTIKEFKAMKPTAHLINIARGAIVNTDDLVTALTAKEISAAALDVTQPEPLPDDHPLLKLDNVLVLPHWGSATIQTRGKMVQLMVDNAKAFVEGKPLLSEINL